jgi:16S rRNA (uracil1498-N3)-methyltransferase
VTDPTRKRRFCVASEDDACASAAEPAREGPAFAPGQRLVFPPAEAHHAAHVLRLRPGDAVDLFDGAGGTAGARLVEVRRGAVTALVEEVRAPLARPAPILHLAFAVPKGSRLDWLLEKATELGAASLVPIRFERSVAGGDALSAAQRRRWTCRCIAAAKQAGLDFLPAIGRPMTLEAYTAGPQTGLGLFGDLSDDARPLRAAVADRAAGPPIYNVVVGPEGGLTPAEGQALRRAGFRPVRLGHTVLRIETAAVALLAGLLSLQP